MRKKPMYISHYLVLKDLLNGVDVRRYSDSIHYLTARIENIKNDFVSEDILFDEKAKAESRFSNYKPYILIKTDSNMCKAKQLLKRYGTKEVLDFLENIQQSKSA